MFSSMQYPHWLMVAGAVLVAIGFIGVAFHRNSDVESDEFDGNEGECDRRTRPGPSPLAIAPAASSKLNPGR